MSIVDARDTVRFELEVRRRLARLDLRRKVRLLSGRDHWSTFPEDAIGLRPVSLSDGTVGIRGVRWTETDTSANIPSATAIAATFDPEIARSMGRVIGAEARRKGIDVILGPVVNLHRSPYCGRAFEAFSEDPVLTAQIGVAMVEGMQAEGVATTAKHFVANEAETERLDSNSVVAERVLRELYLPPFEAIVGAGGLSVMAAYNRVNGTRATDSPLVSGVLKTEWGFDGLVISDWGAVRSVEETAAAGTDLAMPGPHTVWREGLLEAVSAGRVAEGHIDEKVLRILRLAGRVGALEGIRPLVDRAELPAPAAPSDPGLRGLLRKTAALGAVLLRNEAGILPLKASSLSSLAVIGPAALSPRTNGGGSAAVVAPEAVAPLAALADAFPGVEIRAAEGARPNTLLRPLSAENGRAPSGGGVVLIEFLDVDGAVLGSELRNRPDTLVYGMGYPEGISEDQVASIRARTHLVVERDGDYLFSAAGVGHALVVVDGVTRMDGELAPMNSDAVLGMSLPPQAVFELAMAAGQPVAVEFTYTPAPRTVAALRLGFDRVAAGDEELIAEAVEAARRSDVALVMVGTGGEHEAEGFDRTSLALPGRQDDLVRAVAAANPRTVVVVNAGAPVLLPWREEVAAIVYAWFGGQEMGSAVADLLRGDLEPGGRLPVTIPADEHGLPTPFPTGGDVVYAEGLNIGYRRHARSTDAPAYPFGHGLGYTSWAVSGVEAFAGADGIRVRARVQNTGARPGRHVLQAYGSRQESSVERPALWFLGSAVSELAPGEDASIVMDIPLRLFQHWDETAGDWVLEPGEFTVHLGTSSSELPTALRVAPGT